MVCTASLISVFVALLFTWKTSVFWFSLIARPFSVITGRRMIWYADFIRLPPPLFHALPGVAELESPSSQLFLPPPFSCAWEENLSAKAATFQLLVAKRSHGHNGASDKDELRSIHQFNSMKIPRTELQVAVSMIRNFNQHRGAIDL